MTLQPLLLEPGNPYDITREDLEELRARMEQQAGIPVRIAYHPPKGAGVTFDEVLNFWVPGLEFLRDETYSVLLGMVIERMRRRFTGHGVKRRKVIIVRDQDGTELEIVTIDEPEGQEKRQEGTRKEPRPRPPVDE